MSKQQQQDMKLPAIVDRRRPVAIAPRARQQDRLLIKQKEKMTDHHRGESAARSDSFG